MGSVNLLYVYEINNMEGLIHKKENCNKKVFVCHFNTSLMAYLYILNVHFISLCAWLDYLSIYLFNTMFLHYVFSNYCKNRLVGVGGEEANRDRNMNRRQRG